MKKTLKFIALLVTIGFVTASCAQGKPAKNMKSIHQFKVTTLEGKPFDFSSLKGKKVIVVNTASECGLTPQYKDLEAIYEQYKDKGLVIVGFPANNFGAQEPGSNAEIAT